MGIREFVSFAVPLEAAKVSQAGRTLKGYAAVFNQPATVEDGPSKIVRPGAFKASIGQRRTEGGYNVRVLFNHGKDQAFGALPLGMPSVIAEDPYGLYTETPLADTDLNRDRIIPLVASGALNGMSVTVGIIRSSYSDDRSIQYYDELSLEEFGPVTWPLFAGTSALVASRRSPAEFAEVDESDWDGPRAMRECETASDYGKICALDRGSDIEALTARFGLPHHYLSKAPAPNRQGVNAAWGALAGARTGSPMTGPGIPAARSHLESHRRTLGAETSAPPAGSTLGAALTGEGADRFTRILRIEKEHESARARFSKLFPEGGRHGLEHARRDLGAPRSER
jgi:HK97 family phage prohead protease